MEKVKNVLALSSKEAIDYFMSAEQYSTFELPEYFDFQSVLNYVRKKIGSKKYENCLSADPRSLSDVNQEILLNKDGKYAIRPLSLVNPYLYYFLVRDTCDKKNWERIKNCFKKYATEKIIACAIPIIPEKDESFHNSTSILNWWNKLEQRSLELSLEYRYMFVSDITNCYGCINPQILGAALSMQGTKYESSQNNELGDKIVQYLRALQNGKNVGIPQGSEIFNLIAEIILGYGDLLLSEEIDRKGITSSYMILRYRDDYRIFCNDKDDLEEISYLLQKVLLQLNFQMNSKKTMVSESIITDSIKADKQFYIFNTPIVKRRRMITAVKDKEGNERIEMSYENECDFNGLQKHLLFILLFGRKYPNSGQIRNLLNDFDVRVTKILDEKKNEKRVFLWDDVDLDEDYSETQKAKSVAGKNKKNVFSDMKSYKPIWESIRPMVAIATQIALENITAAHYALRVASRLIDTLDDGDTEKMDIIRKVCNKLCNQHNTPYLEIWLQNITYTTDKIKNEFCYTQELCRLVMGENVSLWNLTWLKPCLYEKFPYNQICNEKKLKDVTPVIKIKQKWQYDM